MSATRRSLLAAAPALASTATPAGASDPAPAFSDPAADPEVGELIRRAAAAHVALMRGDLGLYRSLIATSDDFTLMAPFGGEPRHGFDRSSEYRASTARFFRGAGTFDQEVVATYGSQSLVVLVTIERVRGEIGGLPEQDWALRVTQVYRRDRDGWRLVHRHADPLANGVTLEHAAAITRGDTP